MHSSRGVDSLVAEWRDRFEIDRFEWRRARIEAVADELRALPAMRTFVTFVHAHVGVDRVLLREKEASSPGSA